MGNQHSNQIHNQFQIDDWVKKDPIANYAEYGNRQIFKNKHNKLKVDQYQLSFSDSQQYQLYLNCFEWRCNQPQIVNSFHIITKQQQPCCSQIKVTVYLQHIILRLSDITDIPHPYQLLVLRQCLKGYQKLYDHVGFFYVNEGQVCFDAEGQVKVWINKDLSKNYPQSSNLIHLDKYTNQYQLVNSIISMIINNIDQQSQPQSLIHFFQQKNKHTNKHKNNPSNNYTYYFHFEQSLKICEEYMAKHATIIPNNFHKILKMLFKEQYYDEFDKTNNLSVQPPKCIKKINNTTLESIHKKKSFRDSQQLQKILKNINFNSRHQPNNNSILNQSLKTNQHSHKVQQPTISIVTNNTINHSYLPINKISDQQPSNTHQNTQLLYSFHSNKDKVNTSTNNHLNQIINKDKLPNITQKQYWKHFSEQKLHQQASSIIDTKYFTPQHTVIYSHFEGNPNFKNNFVPTFTNILYRPNVPSYLKQPQINYGYKLKIKNNSQLITASKMQTLQKQIQDAGVQLDSQIIYDLRQHLADQL